MRFVRRASMIGTAALAILLFAGCEQHRGEPLAAEGAPPPIANPVGPVPGLGTAAPRPRNPFANDRVAMVEGRKLFTRMNCAGCHGDHAGGGMGPSLRDERWRYGGEAPDIYATIAQGRVGMPAWGTKLPDEQIWKLTAYIQSMRTPLEPEPPTP